MSKQYYAHSLENQPKAVWQKLQEHLIQTAKMAKLFAKPFKAGDWAYIAGLYHDLGKYSHKFQDMLNTANDPRINSATKIKRVDHSTAGGRHVFSLWPDAGKLLAYTIVGHHGGLPDGKRSIGSDLKSRLDKTRKIPDIAITISDFFSETQKPVIPSQLQSQFQNICVGFQVAFFIRMLFSCLVDADFLDTEKFINPQRAALRANRPGLAALEAPLFEKLASFESDTQVNTKRAEILGYCLDAAAKPPGIYTLTVPTGGGKTLSTLAYALRHAIKYDKKRIIYVIPYTSIIEQNAKVFKDILPNGSVLEHHSNYTQEKEKEEDTSESASQEVLRHRLACENWDAPLVVTTNVQFFESLFANRTSKCRKIHNIADSVIILDEAQMLPEPYLLPCIQAIRELACSYNCTAVLCTATQPALVKSKSFPKGLDSIKNEIIPDPQKLHVSFKRVKLSNAGKISDRQLTDKLASYNQILCIVNTRQRAADLFRLVSDLPGSFHLSARMCPAHRTKVLDEIRTALKNKALCRVISTQLVEAGVDVDFPIVSRWKMPENTVRAQKLSGAVFCRVPNLQAFPGAGCKKIATLNFCIPELSIY